MIRPGHRADSGKLAWHLLPLRLLTPVVRVMMFGARKHSPFGWQTIPDAETQYLDAALRHIEAYQAGAERDGETGEHPLAHAICDLIICLWHAGRRLAGRR